ncbi:CCR4-NOT subunit 1 TTP binding [Gracilaria domingensis]|nr:CCR4-NOT subunit 1 TTP binding [Gracilaria domingensis]
MHLDTYNNTTVCKRSCTTWRTCSEGRAGRETGGHEGNVYQCTRMGKLDLGDFLPQTRRRRRWTAAGCALGPHLLEVVPAHASPDTECEDTCIPLSFVETRYLQPPYVLSRTYSVAATPPDSIEPRAEAQVALHAITSEDLRMVSLSRLLAAADDSSSEEPAAPPLPSRASRDCALPPFLASDSIPVRLRLSHSFKRISPSTKEPIPNSNSFRPSPPLPLQRLLRDLGPEATAPSNMATLARTLAHFGRPSEAAVASALLFLTTHVPSESASIDSHIMFHLFALFCGDPENSSIDPLVQQAVATTSKSPREWRADVLVQAVSSIAMQFNAPLDWRLVIHSLDVEGLETQLTKGAFVEIAKAYIAGTGGTMLPADCVLDSWRYPKAQLCIISHALTCPECINWDVLEVFDGALAEDVGSPYSRVMLIERLVELDARDLLNYAVKENSNAVLLSLACAKPQNNTALQQKLTVTLLAPLFAVFPTSERPLRQMWNVSPTLVEAGIVSMWKKDPTTLRTALSISLDMQILPDLLASNVSVDFSLELAILAFQENVLKFESWLTEFLATKGGQAASRIVVCIAHKARIDHATSGQISVDAVRIILRCVINWARRSHANQEKEFIEGVQDVYELYCRLDQRIVDLAPTADVGSAKVIVGSEVPAPPPPTQSDAASTAAAMLLPIAPGSNGSSTAFPPSVEKETDLFFQKLYRSELLPDQAVDILRRMKASNTEHEAQVFNCMLHTLFDEYRFFKDYPDRQLKITGVVFGSIIQYGLVSGGLLGLAVRCVLDALRTVEPAPHSVGRFTKFGLCALERFKNRFYEWPQFCSRILGLSRLKDIAPGLIGEVQQALDINGAVIPSAAEKKIGLAEVDRQPINEPIHSTEEGVPPVSSLRDPAADADAVRDLVASPPLSTSNTPLKGRSVSSTSLRSSPNAGVDGSLGLSPLDLSNLLGLSRDEANQIVVPDESTQDKMKFIFNNLSQSMMDEKVHEMLRILKPKHFGFFAVYIVVKRASSEANFHYLYVELLEKMSEQAKSLLPLVCRTTYKRVNVLLALDRSKTSADRGILKSLGSWIGSLTLARNKPILRRELDLKDALLNAYSNGRLTTVIPFVAKVLEACKDSVVFKPTNPWVRGVLSLMKEICALEDLKLNMKFELQILSKHIGIDVTSIVSSDMLNSRPTPDKTQNPDFTTKKASASPPQVSPVATAASSPEIRRNFPHVPIGPRPGAPVFTLSEQRNGLPSFSKPVPTGLPTSSGRLNLNHGLLSGNIGAVSHESVGELSSILQSASISSGVVGSTQGQRSAIHPQSTIGIGSVPPSATHRTSSSLNAAEMLVPNLSQMVNVSPALGLLETSPNLKRLVPLAIDRAIREIIQPVVERSCAIAFLTTKELTSKDFANAPEHDVNKVRRAAMQMVQQLAGSLALVTSKEPLRVSMGNQLRTILSPSIVADQNMIDQTAQVICNANLDVGCAIIERHAKEKAVRDLNEKIGSAFANRRQTNPASTYGMVPGPDLYRVYEEFSRIHRAGVVPSQYQSQPPVSSQAFQPNNQPSTSKPSDIAKDTPGLYQSNVPSGQFVPEQRSNGAAQDSRGPLRAPASHGAPRVLGSSQGRGGLLSSSSGPGRRMPSTTASGPEPNPRPPLLLNTPRSRLAPAAALGTLLLQMCVPSNVNGYASSQNANQQSSNLSPTGEAELSTQEVLERFNSIYPQLVTEIDTAISSSTDKDMKLADLPPDHEVHTLWVQIPAAVKRSNTADEAGMAVAQKIFKRLFEGESNMYREAHVLILEGLRESCRRLSKELASWLAFSEERRKLNLECILVLLRPGSLLSKTSYDEILAKAIDNGRNITALSFACALIRKAVIEEPLATSGDFYLTLEVILKVARKQNVPNTPMSAEDLCSLVELARNVVHKPETANTSINVNVESHTTIAKNTREHESNDSTTFKEVTAQLLLDWHRILTGDPDRNISDQSVISFIAQTRSVSLASGEAAERFFRIAVEIVCSATSQALNSGWGYSNVPPEILDAPYTAADSLVFLVSTICHTDRSLSLPSSIGAVQVVYYFLVAVAKDAMLRCAKGDLRCHFRLLSCIINQLSAGSASRERSAGENVEANLDRLVSAYSRKLEEVSSGRKGVDFIEDKEGGMLRWVLDLGSIGGGLKFVLTLTDTSLCLLLVGAVSEQGVLPVPSVCEKCERLAFVPTFAHVLLEVYVWISE